MQNIVNRKNILKLTFGINLNLKVIKIKNIDIIINIISGKNGPNDIEKGKTRSPRINNLSMGFIFNSFLLYCFMSLITLIFSI